MPIFKIWRDIPFPTPLLKQYFMCHRVWERCMPYATVEIQPEEKYRWNWRIKDNINFIIFKWNFEHTFTSVQEEHDDYLFISFENSNQVSAFSANIFYEESNEITFENKVTLQVDKMELKDPLLNSVKLAFLEIIKKDYKIFLNNVYNLLQNKELRLTVLEDCYWTNYDTIKFPNTENEMR